MADEHELGEILGRDNVGTPETGAVRPAPALKSMGEQSRQFVFFTPALIVIKVAFDRDPVHEFIVNSEVAPEDYPMVVDVERPLFQGLGVGELLGREVNWDHRIYMVRREAWNPVRDFIGGIGILNNDQQLYGRVMYYNLIVPDPTALQRRPVPHEFPTVNVTIFGISTNHGVHYMAPAKDPPRTLPYPKTAPAEPTIMEEGKILYEEA